MAPSSWDAMNFILYSDVNDSSIGQSLGRPEYSYYFVLKAYRPVLESLGRVHVVASTADVDPLYRQLLVAGEDSLFLSFTPPQKTPVDLECPTVCVVAWEFDSIPDEQWDNDPRQDWTQMLARHGRVITLSSHTARAIRRAMGEDFPVLVLPTPLWENFAAIRQQAQGAPVNPGTSLAIKGCIFDTRTLGLCADALIPTPITPEEEAALAAEIEAARPPPLTLKRRFVIARHYLRLWALDLGLEQAEPVPRVKFLYNWYWEGIRDLVPETLAGGVWAAAGARRRTGDAELAGHHFGGRNHGRRCGLCHRVQPQGWPQELASTDHRILLGVSRNVRRDACVEDYPERSGFLLLRVDDIACATQAVRLPGGGDARLPRRRAVRQAVSGREFLRERLAL
jgi:hypothetical protein